jgi:hypothetical protein
MNAILAGEVTDRVHAGDLDLRTRERVVQEILGDSNSLSILCGLKCKARNRLSGIGQELDLSYPGEVLTLPEISEVLRSKPRGLKSEGALAFRERRTLIGDEPTEAPKTDEVSIPLIRPDQKAHENDSAKLPRDSVEVRIYEKCKGSVARIEVPRKEGRGFGTGFLVGEDGLVATVFHVARDTGDVEVKIDGTTYHAAKVDEDPANDVALLKIMDAAGKKFPTLSLAEKTDELKIPQNTPQKLFTIGCYEYWSKIYMCPGTLIDYTTLNKLTDKPESYERGDRPIIRLRANAKQGMSGSPVVDASGKVFGISDKCAASGPDYSVATPVDALNVLIARYRQSKKVR